MQILLANPPKSTKRNKSRKRRTRRRTSRRTRTNPPSGVFNMAKRKKSKRKSGGFGRGRGGFVQPGVLAGAAGGAAALIGLDFLIDKINEMTSKNDPTKVLIKAGLPRAAAKTGLALGVSFLLRKKSPAVALGVASAGIGSAAVDVYNSMRSGVAGYDDMDGYDDVAGYLPMGPVEGYEDISGDDDIDGYDDIAGDEYD